MSTPWPASLPQAVLLAHGESPARNVAAFQPAVGAPVLYQVGDVRTRRASGRMRLSDAQRDTFLDFYMSECAMGSRRFTLSSASFDGETWLCQWDPEDPYTLEAAAAGWWLQLQLWLVRRLA